MTRWAVLLELNYKPILKGNISHWIRTARTTQRLLQSYREHKFSSRLLHSGQGLIKQQRKCQQKFNMQSALLETSREFRKYLWSNLQLFSHKWSYCRLQPQWAVFIRIFNIQTLKSLSRTGYPALTICIRAPCAFRKTAELNKAEKCWFSSDFPV